MCIFEGVLLSVLSGGRDLRRFVLGGLCYLQFFGPLLLPVLLHGASAPSKGHPGLDVHGLSAHLLPSDRLLPNDARAARGPRRLDLPTPSMPL